MTLRAVLDEVQWLGESAPPLLQPSDPSEVTLTSLFGACQYTMGPSFQFFRTYLEEHLGFKTLYHGGGEHIISKTERVAVSPYLAGGTVLARIVSPTSDATWVPSKEDLQEAHKLRDEIFTVSQKLSKASSSMKQVAIRSLIKYRSHLMKYLEDKLHLEVHLFQNASMLTKDFDIFVVDKTNSATLISLLGNAPVEGTDPLFLMDSSGKEDTLSSWGTYEF